MDRSRQNAHGHDAPATARTSLKRALATAFAGSLFVLAPSAHADTPPTVWDLAKNPDAFAQRRQHLEIERDIGMVEELSDDPQIIARAQTAMAEDHARTLVESWQGPKDTWLRFDDAWVAMKRRDWSRAIPTLENLSKELGTTMFSQEVWQKLAECYVRLERTPDEIHAYDEVLARALSDGERMTPLLNQGEALMRQGDIDAAVAQFREVTRLAGLIPNGAEIALLAQWDLAIALDRSGDFRSALDASRAALRMTKIALLVISPVNSSVYFVPAYERDWYLALGEAGTALESDKPRAAADHWRASEEKMMSYVSQATIHGGDRWLELARKRLDEIRKRRAEADKRAGPIKPGEDADL